MITFYMQFIQVKFRIVIWSMIHSVLKCRNTGWYCCSASKGMAGVRYFPRRCWGRAAQAVSVGMIYPSGIHQISPVIKKHE